MFISNKRRETHEIWIPINVFLLLLVIISGIYFWNIFVRSEVVHGKNWIAKRYGTTYVVSVKNRAELVSALNDFATVNNVKLGNVFGIGAVNEATLRFFNPETKKYDDKKFSGQMEITNLSGNISEMDGSLYTHFHITLGNSRYEALAGHLLNARLNGAGEFVVYTQPKGHIERTKNENVGLNFYDFEK